jgi:outer membrane protein OmpA-like peptidoglycan-associated protein
MKVKLLGLLTIASLLLSTGVTLAQNKEEEPATNLTSKSVPAIGYEIGGGGTKINLVATSAASGASGEAKVEAKKTGTTIDVKVKGMPLATTLGPEFLTYVLWAVTPDGTANNLGEIPIDKNGEGKDTATTASQTFSLIVTAEPYYAVRIPSELVILENERKKNTKGQVFPDTNYKLMFKTEYAMTGNPLALTPDLKNIPLDVYEARNAVQIAKDRGAEKYAPEIFSKASASLQMTENALAQKTDKNQILSTARQTIQFAEDARALSAQRQYAERIQREKEAAAAAAAAKAKQEADARAAKEAQQQAELTAAREAQMKAEAAAQSAEQKAAAQAAAQKAAAEQAALQAREEAAKEEAARAQAQTEALRAQLLKQLNDVLQTTDTPRGLVVNMADVLFETGKFALSQDAQLKLAKLSGIIQAHPGLNLAIEGYTDTTGSADFNLKLSQQRADAVRTFLIAQGLSADTITSKGLGEANPVADNATAAGRKLNRRVEIIVSGEIIGQKMTK